VELAKHLEQILARKVQLITYETVRRGKGKSRYKHIAEDIERTLIHV